MASLILGATSVDGRTPTTDRTVLVVRDATKGFAKHRALDGVSLAVAQSEVLAILGPSGSGKSTLLRCINGLEKLDGGEILLGGRKVDRSSKEIYALRRRMGFVFQSFNLFAHLTALQNVMLGPIVVNRRSKMSHPFGHRVLVQDAQIGRAHV